MAVFDLLKSDIREKYVSMSFHTQLDDSISKKAIIFAVALTIFSPFWIAQMQRAYLNFVYLNKPRAYMSNFAYQKKMVGPDGYACFYENGRCVHCDLDQGQQMIMYDHWPLGFSTYFYFQYRTDKVYWVYARTAGPDLTL